MLEKARNHHGEHAVSVHSKKTNQRMKTIGQIPDALAKVVHKMMPESKFLQGTENNYGKHRDVL